MEEPRYKRVLLKISGEALAGERHFGLDFDVIGRVCDAVKEAVDMGVQVGVVVGGGNFWRGVKDGGGRMERTRADHMGMMATVMNSLAIETALNAAGVQARTMSAVSMPTICETYARQPALHHLDKGQVVVLAGGTGNPYFTTDTAAVLRAAELRCDAVLKATQVDGVYSADPKKDPTATRYDRITHDEAIARDLKVMDTAAFALARESRLSIVVGSMHAPSSIAAILAGTVPCTHVVP